MILVHKISTSSVISSVHVSLIVTADPHSSEGHPSELH